MSSLTWRYHNHEEFLMLNKSSCKFNFKRITNLELKKTEMQFKNSKSPGYDDLPITLLKDGMEQISPVLTCVLNKCIVQAVFPSSEKIAKITPIHKSESKSLLDNYRPISVLPVLSKVFKCLIHKKLSEYLETNNLLSKHQYGFRITNRSTQQAVTILTDTISSNKDNGKVTGAVFLDLKKAFDMVDHARLLTKLTTYSITSTENQWFTNYLFNRKQYVHYNASSSELQSVVRGVPQGFILCSLLFLIFINDHDSCLKKAT